MGKIKSIYNYYLSKDHDLVGFWEKNKNHKEISKTLKLATRSFGSVRR